MAQHKYGIRVKNEKVFIDLIHDLGLAAVTVDLLEVKHSSPVILSSLIGSSGTSKGASFILYNSARLETIFNKFNKKVTEGYYPELPPFDQINLSLLKEEVHYIFYNVLNTILLILSNCRKNGNCYSILFLNFLMLLNGLLVI